MRTVWMLAALAVAAGTTAGGARADGLPVLGIDVGSTGVTTRTARYVTIPANTATVVARIGRRGGRVQASRLLPGNFTIPAVAYDGSASGLAGNGRTLILIEPRLSFPRARTTFAVLDARTLRTLSIVELKGDFSFDAVSPQGSHLYLIQYIAPRDPDRYAVRTYDLATNRLLPHPVTDPREPEEQMRGRPLTRATDGDGRWAYTLYAGAGTPFVHALDTSARTARCIDLDMLGGTDVSLLGLRFDAARSALVVTRAQLPLLEIDTSSFSVRSPTAGTATDRESAWLPAALGAALLAAAATVAARRLLLRRRRVAE
jgi:hypothetical protein